MTRLDCLVLARMVAKLLGGYSIYYYYDIMKGYKVA